MYIYWFSIKVKKKKKAHRFESSKEYFAVHIKYKGLLG